MSLSPPVDSLSPPVDSDDDSSFDRKMENDALNDAEEEAKIKERMKSAQAVSMAYSKELQKLGIGGSLAPAVWAKPIRSPDEKIKLKMEKVQRLDHACEVLGSLERSRSTPWKKGGRGTGGKEPVKRHENSRDHPAVVLNLGMERRPSKRVAVLVDLSESDGESEYDNEDDGSDDPPPLPPATKEHGYMKHVLRRTDSSGRSSPRRFHVKQQLGSEPPLLPPSSSDTPLEKCLSLAMQLHVAYEQLTEPERRKCRHELSLLDGVESLAALLSGATARKLDDADKKTLKRASLTVKVVPAPAPSSDEVVEGTGLPSTPPAVRAASPQASAASSSELNQSVDAILELLPDVSLNNARQAPVHGSPDADLDSVDDGHEHVDPNTGMVRSSSLPSRSKWRKSLAAGSAEPGTPKALLHRFARKKRKGGDITPTLPSLNDILKS